MAKKGITFNEKNQLHNWLQMILQSTKDEQSQDYIRGMCQSITKPSAASSSLQEGRRTQSPTKNQHKSRSIQTEWHDSDPPLQSIKSKHKKKHQDTTTTSELQQ